VAAYIKEHFGAVARTDGWHQLKRDYPPLVDYVLDEILAIQELEPELVPACRGRLVVGGGGNQPAETSASGNKSGGGATTTSSTTAKATTNTRKRGANNQQAS
jgi:hypothetical protein